VEKYRLLSRLAFYICSLCSKYTTTATVDIYSEAVADGDHSISRISEEDFSTGSITLNDLLFKFLMTEHKGAQCDRGGNDTRRKCFRCHVALQVLVDMVLDAEPLAEAVRPVYFPALQLTVRLSA